MFIFHKYRGRHTRERHPTVEEMEARTLLTTLTETSFLRGYSSVNGVSTPQYSFSNTQVGTSFTEVDASSSDGVALSGASTSYSVSLNASISPPTGGLQSGTVSLDCSNNSTLPFLVPGYSGGGAAWGGWQLEFFAAQDGTFNVNYNLTGNINVNLYNYPWLMLDGIDYAINGFLNIPYNIRIWI